MKAEATDELVQAIETSSLMEPKRLDEVTDYILKHYNTKTHKTVPYTLGDKTVYGFNSLFAVGSTQMAIAYYKILKKKIKERNLDLKIAMIYTYQANQDFDDWEPSDDEDVVEAKYDAKAELAAAVEDYNHLFGEITDYSIDGDGFERYYKDVSDKMKKRQLDMLIVVDMFLTGFDSKALNTLWVDRNFKYHGLIQAFSRTNRILTKAKDHGNIVCFRKMKKRVDEAIALFADPNSGGDILIRPFTDYYDGYLDVNNKFKFGFKDLVEELTRRFPLQNFDLPTEEDFFDFVTLFGKVLRLYNLLMSFDDFTEDKRILTPGQVQNYKSYYLDARDQVKRLRTREKTSIKEDVVFEVELLYQNTISISYMLDLIRNHDWGNADDREFKIDLERKITGDVKLRSKLSLIMAFINKVSDQAMVDTDWAQFVNERRTGDLERIITENNLDRENTMEFINRALETGSIRFDGREFTNILPSVSIFNPDPQGRDIQAISDKVEQELYDYYELYKDTL